MAERKPERGRGAPYLDQFAAYSLSKTRAVPAAIVAVRRIRAAQLQQHDVNGEPAGRD